MEPLNLSLNVPAETAAALNAISIITGRRLDMIALRVLEGVQWSADSPRDLEDLCRVMVENDDDLDGMRPRLQAYCAERGLEVPESMTAEAR